MTFHGHGTDDRGDAVLFRRGFLAGVGATITTGLAGCSELTSYDFTAEEVVLPEGPRGELILDETARDSETVSRSVSAADIEGELTITSHYAAYHRGPARGTPTLLEAYLGRANGTMGAGPATVVYGGDAGIEEVSIPETVLARTGSSSTPVSVDPRSISMVIPAATRRGMGDDDLAFDQASPLLYVPAEALPDEVAIQTGGFSAEGTNWFPGEMWIPIEHFCPDSRWLPSPDWLPEDPMDLTVAVPLGEHSPEDLFGLSAEEMLGERIEAGEPLQPVNPFLLAIPATVAPTLPDYLDPGPPQAEVFDVGVPAPTGGATFGIGVLSTPRAEVAGQPQNPFATDDLETLIQSDRASDILRETGLTQAETVEWLDGPFNYGDSPDGTEFTLLDNGAELQTFTGVVSGRDGAWAVGLHLTRVQAGGDAVIGVGSQRSPVYERAPFRDEVAERAPFRDEYPGWATWLDRGAVTTAQTVGNLRHPSSGDRSPGG